MLLVCGIVIQSKDEAAMTVPVQIGDLRGFSGLLIIAMMNLFPYNLPKQKYDPNDQGAMGNTAVTFHNGRVLALSESCYPIELKLDSTGKVTTGDVVRYEGKLDRPVTAHPKIDPETKEMCLFSYKYALSYCLILVSLCHAELAILS